MFWVSRTVLVLTQGKSDINTILLRYLLCSIEKAKEWSVTYCLFSSDLGVLESKALKGNQRETWTPQLFQLSQADLSLAHTHVKDLMESTRAEMDVCIFWCFTSPRSLPPGCIWMGPWLCGTHGPVAEGNVNNYHYVPYQYRMQKGVIFCLYLSDDSCMVKKMQRFSNFRSKPKRKKFKMHP